MRKFRASDAGFSENIDAFLSEQRETSEDVRNTVTDLLSLLRKHGDAALVEATRKFDRMPELHDVASLRVDAKAIDEAKRACSPEMLAALELAANRIRDFHERQKPKDLDYVDELGNRLGGLWRPLDAVGLYVPGGTASYPSSVLMNAIPARVAGVKKLIMVSPAPGGKMNPAVLAAASLAGVDEVWRIGGAQAVGALAYGTASIAAVDKIVGPGNAWVAEAKRQVFGIVGIDMVAGPSEILVVADKSANPRWVAADLLSQAEHDTAARSILITDDEDLACAVGFEISAVLSTLPRADIARESIERHGAIIVVGKISDAVDLINKIAPEHLELVMNAPESLLPDIRHAGAVFLGHYTPEAIGDYIAGPSHVLPTAATARFSSGLSVYDFLKKMSLIHCSAEGFRSLASAAATLADSEGLDAHALSLRTRLNG